MPVQYIDDLTEEPIIGKPKMTVIYNDGESSSTYYFDEDSVQTIFDESDTLSGVVLSD